MDIDKSTLDEYLEPNEAMYIAAREVISPNIVDLRVIHATAKAAELYGFESVETFIGSFVSMIHNPHDITNSRRWALLRHRGHKVPQEYHIRIQRNDGAEIAATKKVVEIPVGDTQIWVANQRALQPESFRPIEPPPSEIVSADDMKSLWGIANVREAELLLRTFGLTPLTTMDILVPMMDALDTKKQATKPITKLDINSEIEYYLYHCLVCDKEWISSFRPNPGQSPKLPKRCNHDDCRSSLWNDEAGAAYARAKRSRSS